jgi:hypothetical protein
VLPNHGPCTAKQARENTIWLPEDSEQNKQQEEVRRKESRSEATKAALSCKIVTSSCF